MNFLDICTKPEDFDRMRIPRLHDTFTRVRYPQAPSQPANPVYPVSTNLQPASPTDPRPAAATCRQTTTTGASQPAETSDRLAQTYASGRFTRIPRSNGVGWSGIGGDASTSGVGAARRLRAGLEAGNCGEGFACLFQMCAALPQQTCADGSVFFHRRLPKAGLMEST